MCFLEMIACWFDNIFGGKRREGEKENEKWEEKKDITLFGA